MKRMSIIPASSLLVTLVIISILLTFIFTDKALFIRQEKINQNEYFNYLNDKFKLIKEINQSNSQRNARCAEIKNDTVLIKLGNINYHFHCEFISLFLEKEPTKKYISFEHIEDYLNLISVPIIKVSSLADLPISSIDEPKIVILTDAISGKLEQDFYGIIITHHYFELKFGAKFYGVLYSSYPNESKNRYITYQSEVIKNLKEKYSYWQYLPHSRNILNNEKSN
ncbi:DUF2572 family protein [Muribacter muris]|nr:DUF2572 family protein [Muribacter muris]